ncbi:MAG: SIS domain-containing protein [Mariniphaga sp.]|nr:SIS domain-containing protein [Mariniphaga sp.]
MNTLDKLFKEVGDFEQFANGYFKYLYDLLNQIEISAIETFVEELEDARTNDNTIFLAGNGGSAATASHMANDIGMDVLKKGKSAKPFRAFALTDNVSVMSAIANDDGYDNVFVNQLKVHYRDGGKLVAISASGNSPNIIVAAEWVKNREGKVIGLVGFDGGRLKDICDIIIHVKTPEGEYGPVEDIHMIIDHLISNWLIYKV